jgi:hypothetical protein
MPLPADQALSTPTCLHLLPAALQLCLQLCHLLVLLELVLQHLHKPGLQNPHAVLQR